MIWILGGAFNPPTKAHFEMIQTILDTFLNDQVIIVPVGDDYQKKELIPFKYRFEMMSIMITHPRVSISNYEYLHPYQGTLKVLEHFKKTLKDHVGFVIGADHIQTLITWRDYEKLLKHYPIIIFNRNHSNIQGMMASYEHLKPTFYDIPFRETVSSSLIRQNILKSKHLLAPNVFSYIQMHHLYEDKHVSTRHS
jgi:nicotinate-nucleotide adenylyltransferase